MEAEHWKVWYDGLIKPAWTPSGQTIGTIWSILYPVLFVSAGYVFFQVLRGRMPRAVALPFILNLAANFAFTPIQFGLRNNPLAAVDILVVWATIPWMAAAVWPHARWVAVAQGPYFAWVSLATVLQLSITWSNWGRG